jgi:protein translocase SecG subunit
MLDAIFSWKMVYGLLLSIYVPACLGLIVIVLLQKGKGVGFAGAFGAGPGGADAVFGPRSSKSLPQKITYTMAGIFMTLSLLMSMLSGNLGSSVAPSLVVDSGEVPQNNSSGGVSSIDDLFNAAPAEAPAAEAPAAPAVEAPAAEAPAAVPVVETPAPAAEVPAPVEAPAAEAPAAQ